MITLLLLLPAALPAMRQPFHAGTLPLPSIQDRH